jgi:hypothetical protein
MELALHFISFLLSSVFMSLLPPARLKQMDSNDDKYKLSCRVATVYSSFECNCEIGAAFLFFE